MKAGVGQQPRIRTTPQAWGVRVELCAPQVRNALDPEAVAALLEVFSRDEPGAVLLSAQGPVFCAGGDLSVLGRGAVEGDLADVLLPPAAAFADLIEAVLSCPRPVVAAIDGPAVGGGASLALACDVRLATSRARLALAWARWGLPPDGGATALLSARVGAAEAHALLADAADIGTDSPVAAQLFEETLSAADLEPAAVERAAALASAPDSRAAKAAATAPVLAAVRAGREAELAALARAAADATVVARLANVYKMEK